MGYGFALFFSTYRTHYAVYLQFARKFVRYRVRLLIFLLPEHISLLIL